jgi:signal transduction histidine kinase
LSFTSPENVNVLYKLKNYDADWNDAGTQHAAKYPRLPPGRYEFQVRACNNAGVWNEAGFRLGFDVTPFFWQRWWFRAGAVILFTISVIGLVRYFSFRRLRRELERLEHQAELQRERARIARDMHDEVGSKLSRLSFLSEMAGQQPGLSDMARDEVAEISETARDTIRSFEEIVWAVNPNYDSLAHLMNYLCRFAEDFFDGSATQCLFDVPDKIPEISLPTGMRHHLFLAAKEALNNVFKHAQARRVLLRMTVEDSGFEIVIEDDGRCFGSDAKIRPGAGNGLENMRERMRQAGGEFEIHSSAEGGTRVTFRVRGNSKNGGHSTFRPTVGRAAEN